MGVVNKILKGLVVLICLSFFFDLLVRNIPINICTHNINGCSPSLFCEIEYRMPESLPEEIREDIQDRNLWGAHIDPVEICTPGIYFSGFLLFLPRTLATLLDNSIISTVVLGVLSILILGIVFYISTNISKELFKNGFYMGVVPDLLVVLLLIWYFIFCLFTIFFLQESKFF